LVAAARKSFKAALPSRGIFCRWMHSRVVVFAGRAEAEIHLLDPA